MSSCDNSNIRKNYIVTGIEQDVLSACTGFFTNDIYPCTGDTITIHSDILSANTINSAVYLSGGTNLLDIFGSMDTNTFVTGVTYDNSNNLSVDRNDGVSFEVNISEFSGLTINGVLSACTGIYTSNLYGCSPITVQDDLILLSGLTLSAITNDDSLTEILVRDSVTGLVKYRDVSSITPDTNTFVTGFTYDDSNNLTISRNDGTDFTTNIDIMSGLTIDGDLLVTGTTNISGITSINSSLDVYNGTIGLRTNDYFLQGTSTGGTNVQLIGVYSNDEILIGNQGYTNRIMDDTIIKGELDILSGLTLSQTPTLNNSGTDILIRNSSTGEVEYRPVSGITPNTNTFVTGFTYNNANTLTISDNSGSTFNASINTVTGLTSNGDIEVIGDVIVTGGTGNVSSKQFYVEGNLGLDWDFGSNSVTLGNVSDGTIINGTSLTVNSDTTINGNLSATTISATTYFGDGSNLTGIPDNFVSGGTYNVGTNNINFSGNNVVTTFDVDLSSLISSVSADTFVISGNADAATSLLTFTNNSGGTFNVTNSAALFSDNDINVTGGTYNPSTGCVTFITNSGTTFDVCGFVTGITDTYTTGSTLVGETIQFDSNVLGPNYYNVSLSPVLSGKTDNLTFNSYTSNTETILNSKVSGATNLSTTGLFAQKNGDNLEFKGLTSTGGTVTITNDSTTVNLEVVATTDTNSFSTGGTVTQSATSGDSEVIVQIVGNSGFTPYNITGLTDTFVNDFSISSNTFTISQNDGSSFVATADTIDLASVLSAVTFDIGTSGSISATTFNGGAFNGTFVGDGSGLTGITDNDTFVTGTTFASNQLTLTRNDNVDIFSLSGGSNVTLSETATNDILIDVSLPSSMNTFVTGGTYNESTDTITLTRNDAATVDITGVTDTFTTGSTYDNGTALATFTKNDGTTYTLDLSTIDVNDTFVTGFTYNNTNTFTISRNDGVDLNTSINTMTGLTVNGDITVTGTSNLNAVTATTIDFDLNYTGATAEGRLSWNFEDATLDLGMGGGNVTQQIGQEIYYIVKNQSGATISNGRVVRNAGSFGASGRILGEYMIADGTYPFAKTLGISTEDILNGEDGLVTEFGVVRGIDTTGSLYGESWSDGDVLYVSPTIPGGLTSVEPSAPNQVLEMGVILNAAANGSIFVDRHLSTKLGDISDIQTTGATNGDLIVYNSATTVWEYSKVLTGDYDINGTLSASTIDGSTILSGGTNLTTIIESLDTYVTGGTVSVPATDNTNSGSIGLFYKNSDGTPRTLPFEDTYTTGSTYDNGTELATFNRNDGNSYTLDLSTIDVNDTFSTGGTVTQSSSNNENNQTIQIVGNGGFTPYNITNVTDTFTTGGTYNNGTALITFDKNDGTTYDVDLSTLDLNDTFVTGTTFSSNQATVTRNDGTDVLLLTGGTNVTLSNPSTNQIKIDVTSSLNITTVSTTTYTATTSDEIIGVDTTSNAVTITLPDSLSSGTLRYEIKDIGFNSRTNPITIQVFSGSDRIITTSLVSSFTLSADGGAVVLINTAARRWWQM